MRALCSTPLLLGMWLLPWLAACQLPNLDNPAPLKVRNLHPVQLTAIHPTPRAAQVQHKGEVQLGFMADWANICFLPVSGADSVTLDLEVIRSEYSFRVGLLSWASLIPGSQAAARATTAQRIGSLRLMAPTCYFSGRSRIGYLRQSL